MASGPIYFSATTKSIPVDDLNNRLKALGRKEIITSIKSHPFAGGYNHDVCYLNSKGEEWTYIAKVQRTDSMDHFAEKFFTHISAAEQVAKERAERIAAEQKKSEAATAGVDYTVWIWGIEYPNARVEYHDGIEQVRSVSGFTHGIYKAGAKTSGVPRTDEPFDIVLRYRNGDVVALHGCSWVADGEVCCTNIMKNGKSSYIDINGNAATAAQQKAVEWGVAAAQKISAGAVVASDGKVVGKATPARGVAYLNGVPVGVLTGIDYSGVVHLNTDAEGRVTTNAQQVKEAIDRAPAISVPTEKEIERRMLEHVMRDVPRFVPSPTSESVIRSVAASTHKTYKAIAQVAEGLRLQQDDRRAIQKAFDELMDPACRLPNYIDFMQNSRITGVTTNKDGNTVLKIETQLPQPPANVNIPLDFAPAIGDTVTKETASMPTLGVNEPLSLRAKTEAIEVAYRTAAIKLPDLVRKQLVKRMAAKGGKRPSQARLSLAEEMLSGDEGSLIVAGILSLALSASPEFIKSKMPWLDLDRLAKELRLNVETRIACAVADMLGMYLDGALEALKEAFGGSQLLLAEGGKSDESALFNGVPKAETVRV